MNIIRRIINVVTKSPYNALTHQYIFLILFQTGTTEIVINIDTIERETPPYMSCM